MANSSRLCKNRNDQMLIPMNVEGGMWQDGFFTSGKGVALVIILFGTAAVFAWMSNQYLNILGKILITALTLYLDSLILRFVILEEKYNMQLVVRLAEFSITTPSVFWNIISIRDTEDGAILMYSNGKIGVIARLERDTIVGKNSEFKEIHFDAISDFYKEVNNKNLMLVQMDLMEPAGKDSRIAKLDEVGTKATNENIAKLIECQVGHIKKVTRSTLSESNYVLFYTDDISRVDSIMVDVIDCLYKLLDGAYVGYEILSANQTTSSMVCDEYNVKYFDSTEATVNLYRNSGGNIARAAEITGIVYADGTEVELDTDGMFRISTLTGYVKSGAIKKGEWTVRNTLERKGNKEKNFKNRREVTFDDILETGKQRIREQVEAETVDLDDIMFGERPKVILLDKQDDNEGSVNTADIEENKPSRRIQFSKGKKQEKQRGLTGLKQHEQYKSIKNKEDKIGEQIQADQAEIEDEEYIDY